MSVKVTTEVAEVEASKAPPDAPGQASRRDWDKNVDMFVVRQFAELAVLAGDRYE